MLLDIDQIVQHVLPWDFSVKIDGKKYATRRPSIAELGALQNFDKNNLKTLQTLIEGLFAEPPAVRWDLTTVLAFISGYVAYFSDHVAKKDSAAAEVGIAATRAVEESLRSSGGSVPQP